MAEEFKKQFVNVSKPKSKPSAWHSSSLEKLNDKRQNLWLPCPAPLIEQQINKAKPKIQKEENMSIPSDLWSSVENNLTKNVNITSGYKSVGNWCHLTNFVWLLSMNSDFLQICSTKLIVNMTTNSGGLFTSTILRIIKSVYQSRDSMSLFDLILILRRYGPPCYHQIDMQSEISLPRLIESLLNCLNIEWSGVSNCPYTNNFASKKEISQQLNLISQSRMNQQFGIILEKNFKCTSCNTKWRECEVARVFSMPIYGQHARYIIKEADDDTRVASWLFIPPEKLATMTMVDLIKHIVIKMLRENGEVPRNAAVDVQFEGDYVLIVNNLLKFVVYGEFLTQNEQIIRWDACPYHKICSNAFDYCNQFIQTLILWQIPSNSPTTKFNWHAAQIQITDTKQILPKTNLQVHFDKTATYEVKRQTKAEKETDITAQTIQEEHKSGDEAVSLVEHMQQLFTKGIVIYKYCSQCSKTRLTIYRPVITKIANQLLLYIDQKNSKYYQIKWPYYHSSLSIPINTQKKQQMNIVSLIAQPQHNEFVSYWSSREENKRIWYSMKENKMTRFEQNDIPEVEALYLLCLSLP